AARRRLAQHSSRIAPSASSPNGIFTSERSESSSHCRRINCAVRTRARSDHLKPFDHREVLERWLRSKKPTLWSCRLTISENTKLVLFSYGRHFPRWHVNGAAFTTRGRVDRSRELG